jgi:tyrosine decarboxylase
METDVQALFLGPKSENRKFFKEMLNFVIDEHIHWRRDFHPSDPPVASISDRRSANYEDTLMRTEEALLELSSRLKSGSIPAFSPRYLGHMLSDTLMAANLGYLATILYNPNNCSYEASSASTPLEIEVGQQLAVLFGYDPEEAWGHITSGGTVANYEALWVARNLKSLGQALERARPDLMQSYSPIEKANLPVSELLNLLSRVKDDGDLARVRKDTAQYRGAKAAPGKLLVPQSMHYSWVKAVDILGLGQDNLIPIPVGSDFRMDSSAFVEIAESLMRNGEPILAVVAVTGTTEVGAVDEIHKLVHFRNRMREELGTGFYLHVDAAYGGYARSIFLDEDNRFLGYEQVQERLDQTEVLTREVNWPPWEVYEAFRAVDQVDSVTVDPHKLGYVPYAAGGIVMKDRRVLDLISYFAAYVFEDNDTESAQLGAFVMEGSRPGASAASVWMAHRVLPLNSTGYGKLIGHSVDGAQRLYQAIQDLGALEVEGRTFQLACISRPDLNVIDFLINESGNKDLVAANTLNRYVYDQCSYRSGPVYLEDFILSKTILSKDTYGWAAVDVLSQLGISELEWTEIGEVFVLRSCMMTPYLTSNQTFDEYLEKFQLALRRHLKRYIQESFKRPEATREKAETHQG